MVQFPQYLLLLLLLVAFESRWYAWAEAPNFAGEDFGFRSKNQSDEERQKASLFRRTSGRTQVSNGSIKQVHQTWYRHSRRLQDGETQVLNVVFDAPEVVQQEVCGNNVCVTAIVGSTIYYFGDDPEGFIEQLQQAIADGLFEGIDGLVSISVEDLTPTTIAPATTTSATTVSTTAATTSSTVEASSSTVEATSSTSSTLSVSTTPVSATTSSTSSESEATTSTLPSTTTIATTTTTTTEPGLKPVVRGVDDDSLGVGPSIAVAGGALLFCLLITAAVARRRRSTAYHLDEHDSPGQVKHRQFTVDEEDGRPVDANEEVDIRLVGSEEESPWESFAFGGSPMIQEASEPTTTYPTDEELQMLHGPNESCSSPTCEFCEQRRRQGPTFLRLDDGQTDADRDHIERPYIVQDTVEL